MSRHFSIHLLLLFFITTFFLKNEVWAIRSIKTIVIDAGHGGKDPGTLGRLSKEKTVALKVALKVGNYLKVNFPDVKVIYTRNEDVFVGLDERAAFANKWEADLFISIHLNSCTSSGARGTEVYYFPPATSLKTDISEWMADSLAKKAKTGGDPNKNYSRHYKRLLKMSKAKTQDDYIQSIKLAKNIDIQLKTKGGRKTRGVRSSKLLVLGLTQMPAVLVEIGYLSNPTEEKFMSTDEGQTLIASSIYRGIKNYKLAAEGKKTVEPKEKTDELIVEKITNKVATKPIAAKPTNTKPTSTKPATEKKTSPSPSKNTAKVETPPADLYRIQLGVFNKKIPVTDAKWTKVSKLKVETLNGKFVYYATGYNSQKEAIAALLILRKNGFPDAFVNKKD